MLIKLNIPKQKNTEEDQTVVLTVVSCNISEDCVSYVLAEPEAIYLEEGWGIKATISFYKEGKIWLNVIDDEETTWDLEVSKVEFPEYFCQPFFYLS